jgi:hypothetical protein
MTRLNIFHTAKPSRDWRGLQPMSKADERAWRITRERHPYLYQKELTK